MVRVEAVDSVQGTCTVTIIATGVIESQGPTTYDVCRTRKVANVKAAIWVQGYSLLAPLPCPPGTAGCSGTLKNFDASGGNGKLGEYLNLMIKIFIGLCAVMSVVMIVIGGMEYITSELPFAKESGKDRIAHALLGLVIALGAYALLFTINPDLLKSDFNPPAITSTSTGPGLTVGGGNPNERGTCLFVSGSSAQTTQAGCNLNPNSVSWNGTETAPAAARRGIPTMSGSSGNYCGIVLINDLTRRGQAQQTHNSEICRPTMVDCEAQVNPSRYSVVQPCYLKTS